MPRERLESSQAELVVTRAAADAIIRQVPNRAHSDLTKVEKRRSDVAHLSERLDLLERIEAELRMEVAQLGEEVSELRARVKALLRMQQAVMHQFEQELEDRDG